MPYNCYFILFVLFVPRWVVIMRVAVTSFLCAVSLFVSLPLSAQFTPPSAPSIPSGGGGRSFSPSGGRSFGSSPSSRSYTRPSTPTYRAPTVPNTRPNVGTGPSTNPYAPRSYTPGAQPRVPGQPYAPGAQPYAPGGQRSGNPFAPGGRGGGPVFRNPLAPRTAHVPRSFDPRAALRSVQVPLPNVPGVPATTPSSYTWNGNPSALQDQITKNLQGDQSLHGLMSAVDALDRHGVRGQFTTNYRTQALSMAQQQIRAGATDPLPWIATAKLSSQTGNDSLFRRNADQFVQKFPTNPHAHLFKGMQALKDEDWKSAETSLRQARALGIPEASIAAMLKMAIVNQKWIWQYAQIIFGIIVVWLAGLLALYLLGSMLSRVTLRAIERDQLDAGDWSTRMIRRIYRVVVGAAGIYYYISLPIILICAIALPLTIGYAALSTPYLNLLLLAVILIGGLGGIITAISGIRTAFIRIPESETGMKLKRDQSPEFWKLVHDVADEIGTRGVDQICITPSTELGVMERGSWWARFRDRGRRVLILGAALLNGWKADSLRAVLAHEYAHFRHRDTAGGDIALRVLHSMHRFAGAITERGKIRWWDITIHFLRIYHALFMRLTLGASRLQEVLADRAAVQLCGTAAFIDGLKHVIRRDIEFDQVITNAIDQSLKSGPQPANFVGATGARDPRRRGAVNAALQQIFDQPTTIYDSHPAPQDRLAMARRWNVRRDGDDRMATDCFEEGGEPLQKEMSSLLRDFVKQRATDIREFNQMIIDAITDALHHHGDDVNMRMERARLNFEINEHDKALQDINHVIKLAGDHPTLRWFRAGINDSKGDSDAVIGDLLFLQKRERELPFEMKFDVTFMLGQTLAACERYDEAAAALDRAVKLDPKSYSAAMARIDVANKQGKADDPVIKKLKASALRRWPDLLARPNASDQVEQAESSDRGKKDWLVWPTLVASAAMLLLLVSVPLYAGGKLAAGALRNDEPVVAVAAAANLAANPQPADAAASRSPSKASASVDSPPGPSVDDVDVPDVGKLGKDWDQAYRSAVSSMRQIASAIRELNLEEVQGFRPPQTRTNLSWRVHLLPRLGEKELYEKFHLHEPWTSEHNVKQITEMPEIYRYGLDIGYTRFRSVPREGRLNDIPHMIGGNRFPDGDDQTATIFLTGRRGAVHWTRPESVVIPPYVLMQSFGLEPNAPTAALNGRAVLLTAPRGMHPLRFQAIVSVEGNEHVAIKSWFNSSAAANSPPQGYRPDQASFASARTFEEAGLMQDLQRIGQAFTGLEITREAKLSWRVHALPALGYDELYQRFNMDEPWYSKTNYALIDQMPAIYRMGSPPGRTRMRVIGRMWGFRRQPASKLTLVYGERHQATTWTRPEQLSWPRRIERLTAPLYRAFSDGRAVKIPAGTSMDKMRTIFDLDDHTEVDIDAWFGSDRIASQPIPSE